jgi:hypothetical protein
MPLAGAAKNRNPKLTIYRQCIGEKYFYRLAFK